MGTGMFFPRRYRRAAMRDSGSHLCRRREAKQRLFVHFNCSNTTAKAQDRLGAFPEAVPHLMDLKQLEYFVQVAGILQRGDRPA
jgi:hypothetical protein